jgi:hypothetical protein
MNIKTNRFGTTSSSLLAGLLAVTFMQASTSAEDGADKFIFGDTATIAGGTAATWARVNGAGKVIWVGLTFPLSMVENMPPRGSGPAGAIAVLNFPAVVQATTYFNHVEIHSNRMGHPAAGEDLHRYEAPHFDFHFYNIPVADVWPIPAGIFTSQVPAERLPAGYGQPEPRSVPQMGRHCQTLEELAATEEDHWLYTMTAGFMPDASYMHFIEPMVTRELLLTRQNFSLPVPTPAVLGLATRYPSECEVHYDEDSDAYHIVFRGFEPVE